ncbi:MAG: AAA family ATPase [Methanobacteriaceae archaeon]|nr:AAA family ATPase [Methanobacteriaceae archaeon]
MKIGLAYVKGAVPGLENFGNIPTDLIKSNGLLKGNPISQELDGLIIPGGSILESKSISEDFKREIKTMAKDGKPIIGICAGYQLLSNQLDITNPNNNYSIENSNPNYSKESNLKTNIKEGLSLLDVNFSYLFSNDKVVSKVANDSYLTKDLYTVNGFHCHSYGGVSGDAKVLFYSPLRVNYSREYTDIVSGSINDDGNVIGTMIHNILDDNPKIVSNFFEFIDATDEDIKSIYNRNKILQNKMKNEIAIDTNILVNSNIKSNLDNIENPFLKFKKDESKAPKVLLIGSTSYKSGKTFLTAGIASNLMEKGLNVGVLKLGSNIKDILQSLYLTKANMEPYSLIKNENTESKDINQSDVFGWSDISQVISNINNSNYDIVLIEGEKAIFDNLTNPNFYSTVEISLSSNIPILLISSAKEALDYGITDLIEHEKILYTLGIKLEGAILNNIQEEDFNSYDSIISSFKNSIELENIFKVPKVDSKFGLENSKFLDNQLNLNPSNFENRYDIYSLLAHYIVKNNLDILKIAEMSKEIKFNKFYSLEELELFNKFLS